MNRFKVVEYHYSPNDKVYRIYQRRAFLFWEHLAERYSLDDCDSYFRNLLAEEARIREEKEQTPKPKILFYT
jgi:hypothetical protein